MTAQTPVYGLKYPALGEPIRAARAMLQSNAETIEAALVAGGVAAPGASDLLALSGRVTTAESDIDALQAFQAAQTPAWTTPTMPSGFTAVSGFQVPQYRKVGDRVEWRGVMTGIYVANQLLFTMPVGYRPTGKEAISISTDAAGMGRLDVATDGTIRRATGGSWSTTVATYVSFIGVRWFTS